MNFEGSISPGRPGRVIIPVSTSPGEPHWPLRHWRIPQHRLQAEDVDRLQQLVTDRAEASTRGSPTT